MKKLFQFTWFFVALLTLMCKASDSGNQLPETILMDAAYLAHTKTRIAKEDPKIKHAFDRLIKEAESALKKGPFSVTDKEKLPPSGNQHDYASYSRYWWPDPDKPDGLPYIRRDGETIFSQ